MQTTTQELFAAREHFRSRVIPAASLALMDRETESLKATNPSSRILTPGMKAPDFLLPDVQGQLVSLSSLIVAGPAVLVFYRGGWCPYCNIQLRGLERTLPQIRATGASLVAISPQLPDQALSTAEKNNLHFPVLSDVGNHIARRFGIGFELSQELTTLYSNFGHALAEVNGKSGATELPIPSVFIVDTDLTILHAASDIDYTRRMDPEEIVAVLTRTSL